MRINALGMQTKKDKPAGRVAPADKIKFAVGYQLADPDEESFPDIVRDYRAAIDEVYFPWSDLPSGRAALTQRRGHTDWNGQQRMEAELREFRKLGLRLAINAYASRKYAGNLLNLFEPGFGPALAPAILDNQRFPADWFERTAACGHQCQQCDYCKKTLRDIAVKPHGNGELSAR